MQKGVRWLITNRQFGTNIHKVEPSGKVDGSIIFLHGLGDSGASWKEIAQVFAPTFPTIRWILPDAPQRYVTINGCTMPAWYDIETLSSRSQTHYEGLDESKEFLEKLIAEEKQKGIPPMKIIVGGFSQGAAVSLYSGIQFKGILGGILALSGYLPKDIPSENRKNIYSPVMMCHGKYDPVVKYEWAVKSFETIESYGVNAKLHTYKMEHELHPDQIMDITNFLYQVFGNAKQ